MSQSKFIVNKATPPGEPLDFNLDGGTFKLETSEIPELSANQVLFKTLYLSNDPVQRMWLTRAEGQVVPARAIAEVVESKNPTYSVGDYYNVSERYGWRTHLVAGDEELAEIEYLKLSPKYPLEWYIGALGAVGKTAYVELFRTLGLTENDVGKSFLITAAAGAVGSVAVQIAANVLKGKVFAVAGGPEKVKLVESLGPDVVGIDYKSPDFEKNIVAAIGGDGVDYMIDHVGGPILDLAVNSLIKPRGKIVACGSISGYNDKEQAVLHSWLAIIFKRLTIEGILVSDYKSEYPRFDVELAKYLDEGKIKVEETVVHIDDFKDVPTVWRRLFKGQNRGKLITKV